MRVLATFLTQVCFVIFCGQIQIQASRYVILQATMFYVAEVPQHFLTLSLFDHYSISRDGVKMIVVFRSLLVVMLFVNFFVVMI